MSNEEFEELFRDTPFVNIKKIETYIEQNYVHKSKIKEKINNVENSTLNENIKACVCNKLAQLL